MANKYIPLIPNLPADRQEDDFESRRNTALQNIISNEGIKVPHQDTDTINSLNKVELAGNFLYDKVTKQMKVNIDGVFKTILTS